MKKIWVIFKNWPETSWVFRKTTPWEFSPNLLRKKLGVDGK